MSVFHFAMRPVLKRVWNDERSCARSLLRFAETEADGGRDIARAAELTGDALLRRLFLRHALDEQRHAILFRRCGTDLIGSLQEGVTVGIAPWIAPGERGLDDLRVETEDDASLLAFLHLSERAAAADFRVYRNLVPPNASTRTVFDAVLKDEVFHMNYTFSQLKRVAPTHHRWLLWSARANRLWKGYLRIATSIANLFSTAVLVFLYFVLLPPFALLAKRSAKLEAEGWQPITPKPDDALTRQY